MSEQEKDSQSISLSDGVLLKEVAPGGGATSSGEPPVLIKEPTEEPGVSISAGADNDALLPAPVLETPTVEPNGECSERSPLSDQLLSEPEPPLSSSLAFELKASLPNGFEVLARLLNYSFKVILKAVAIFATTLVVLVIILCLTMFLFGRQIVDAADAELKKQPYIAFPVKGLAYPLFDGSELSRKTYFKAAENVACGWFKYGVGISAGVPARKGRYLQFLDEAFRLPYEQNLTVALNELSKLQAMQKDRTDIRALQLFTYYGLGLSQRELIRDSFIPDSAVYFEKAKEIAVEQVGKHNFLIGDLERRIAQVYLSNLKFQEADLHAKAALECDSAQGSLEQAAAVWDRQLLLDISRMQNDRSQIEARWDALLTQEKRVHGENSLPLAEALVGYAQYFLYNREYARSLQEGEKSFAILKKLSEVKPTFPSWQHPNITLFGRVLIPETEGKNSNAANSFLNFMGSIRRSLAASRSSDPVMHKRLKELDSAYVSWVVRCYGDNPRRVFQFLEKVADDYSFGKDYATADAYYKKALSVGAQSNMWVESNRREKTFPSDSSVRSYLLCMAKTAHNSFLLGNLSEGLTISRNLLNFLDPYKNWISSYNSYDVVQELIYAFGELPRTSHTDEIKQLQAKLVEIVEMKRLNKAAFGFGLAHDRSIMLAELYELQKNYPAAQKYYREASENAPSNIRNLGAYAEFLARHGDKKEAGKLFEQFEAITYSIERPKHFEVITVVADARLKAIMDLSTDKSYMSDPHFQWVPAVRNSICDNGKTSAKFGERASIIDLRPLILDSREAKPPKNDLPPPTIETQSGDRTIVYGVNAEGTVYDAESARADIATLSAKDLNYVKKNFKWYKDLYRKGEVLRENLSDEKVSWFSNGPRSLRDLKPVTFLIISKEDSESLKKMLGRELTSKKLK